MKIIYKGADPELTIMAMGGRTPILAKKGEAVEVPDEDAKSLLQRGDFEAVDKKAKEASK